MKKQQIKQLTQSIIEADEVTENIFKWIIGNLSKNDLKLLIRYLSYEIKERTVIVKYAGNPSDIVKNKIQNMFPDKSIVYVKDDNEVGAGIRFEFGDYILDYTISNMIVKIMKSIRESL